MLATIVGLATCSLLLPTASANNWLSSERPIIMRNDAGDPLFEVIYDLNAKTAWVNTCYSSSVEDGVLTLPDAITVDNVNYPIISLGNARANVSGSLNGLIASAEKLVLGKNIERIDSAAITWSTNLAEVEWNEKCTYLGADAFTGAGLVEFELPAIVNTMVGNPFRALKTLTSLTVSPDNKDFVMQNGIMWSKDMHKLCFALDYTELPETYSVPEECTEIGSSALRGHAEMKNIKLNNVESIGDFAFLASGLTSLTIGRNVKNLGQTINRTTDLTVTLNPGNPYLSLVDGFLFTKETGVIAHYKWEPGLATVTVPEGVKVLSRQCLQGNLDMTKIVFPSTLEEICYAAMYRCFNLEEANFEDTKLRKIGDLTIQESAIKKVIMPSTLRYIGSQAFYSSEIEELQLNEGLEYIGFIAFQYCKNLKEVTIPSTIDVNPYMDQGQTSIFNGCTGLTKAVVKCKILCSSAFYSCTSLSDVTLEEGLEEIMDMAFAAYGTTMALSQLTFPSTLKKMDHSIFQFCNFENVVLPAGLEDISYNIFGFNSNLTSLKVQGCKRIGSNLAQACTILPSDGLILENIEDLGSRPAYSTLVTTYTLPASLKRFGGQIANDANNPVEAVICNAVEPPYIYPVDGSNWFEEVEPGTPGALQGVMFENPNSTIDPYEFCQLFVPAGSVEAYKAHEFWGKFYTISGVNDIAVEDDGMSNCIYFDMNGNRIANPSNGIFIKYDSTSRKAIKVIVK